MQHHSSSASAHEGWPSTKRYSRTMNDAFRGADYGCAIEHYRRDVRTLGRVAWWAAAACAAVTVALAFAGY